MLDRHYVGIAVGLSGAGLAVLFWLTREALSWEALRVLSPWVLAVAAAMVAGLWFTEGLRIWFFAHLLDNPLPLTRVIQLNLAVSFLAGVTPLAAGGPPGQLYLLTKAGMAAEKAALVVTLRLLFTIIFFGLVTPVLLIFFRAYLPLSPWVTAVIYLSIGGLLAVFVLFFVLLYHPELARQGVAFLLNRRWAARWRRRHADWPQRAYQGVLNLQGAFRLAISRGLGLLLIALLLTGAYWALYFSIAPALLIGFGLQVPFFYVLARLVVMYFIISYTPLPGASGVAELGLATLFAGVVPAPLLPVFVAAWRFFTYYINLVAGGISLGRLFMPAGLKLN